MFPLTAMLNHSCFPNAVWEGEKGIWATYDIKEGQEITINYREGKFFGMRKREYRQEILYEDCGFTCFCDLCKKQDHGPTGASQTEIEELIEEAKKLYVDMEAARDCPIAMLAFCLKGMYQYMI